MRRALLLLAAFLAACGEAGPPRFDARVLPPPQLVVVNKCASGTPALDAIHLHSTISNYQGTKNYLTQPLKLEESTLIASLTAGQYYLTVIRPKTSFTGAPILAITTKTPLELATGIYELWIFDESFRLWPPKTPIADLSRPREAGHDLRPGIDLDRRDARFPDQPRPDRGPDAPRESGTDAPRDGGVDAPRD